MAMVKQRGTQGGGNSKNSHWNKALPWPGAVSFRTSLQALKHSHAPETGATGFRPDVTVLLKGIGLDIVTRSQGATEAVGIIVEEHILAEPPEGRVVPDVEEIPLRDGSERLRSDELAPSLYVALVAVPQEVTGVHVTVP